MIRKNTKTGIKLLVLIIFSGTVLIAHSVSSLALQELMSLQANVEQSGTALQSGNVIVTIWDAPTGGNLIYNSTTDFYNTISNGKFDIVLGNSTNSLNLEYGKIYYTDFEINGSDVDFKGLERQIFQSSVGNISTEDIRDRSINPADLNNTAAYLFNRIALGGISSQAYNTFSDSKTAAFASTDNDLFIEDILEVGGSTYLTGYAAIGNSTSAANLTVTGNLSVSDISCNSASCISSGEITDATISANDMAVSSVNTTHIADGTITAADLTGDLGLGFGNLTAYPSACSAGQFISALGDNQTCGTPTDTNESVRFNALTGTDCTNNQKAVGFDNNGLIVCTADNDTTYTHLSNFTNNLNLTNAIILHWDNITNKYYNTTAELRLALPYNTSNEIFTVVNNGTFVYVSNEGNLNTNRSNYWDNLDNPNNLTNLIILHWDNITNKYYNTTAELRLALPYNTTAELRLALPYNTTNEIFKVVNNGSFAYAGGAADSIWINGTSGIEINSSFRRFLNISTGFNISIDEGTLAIDSSNNRVGIGTASPGTALEVRNVSSTQGILYLSRTSWPAGTNGSLDFVSGSTPIGRMNMFIEDNSNTALTFSTYRSGTLTEAMRINASGNVGIGTASPATKLDVNGQIRTGTSGGGANGLLVQYSAALPDSYSNLYTVSGSDDTLVLQSWDSKPLSLNPNGNNVGIGTTNPGNALDVIGIINGSSNIHAAGGALSLFEVTSRYPTLGFNSYGSSYLAGRTGYGFLQQFDDVTGTMTLYNENNVTAGSGHSHTSVATIDSSGNLSWDSGTLFVDAVGNRVGIGTTSPGAPLQIHKESATAQQLMITNAQSATNAYSSINFQYSATDNSYQSEIRNIIPLGGTHGSNLAFFTDHNATGTLTERMRIDSLGNIGIGTASPSEKTTIVATTGTPGLLVSSNSALVGANTSIRLGYNSAASGGADNWANARLRNAVVTGGGADLFIETASASSGTSTWNTNQLVLTATGEVGIGTATPSYKLHVVNNVDGDPTAIFENDQTDVAPWDKYTAIRLKDPSNWYSEIRAVRSGNLAFVVNGGSAVEAMRIDSTGDVGIGTDSPGDVRLYVNKSTDGNWVARIDNTWNQSNGLGLRITSGNNSGDSAFIIGFYSPDGTETGKISSAGGTVAYGTFTGVHDASIPEESNEEGYAYGTVMCINATTENPQRRKQADYSAVPCSKAYDKSVFGIYSNKYEDRENKHAIFALGDGHILVTDEGGNIEIGDYLTTSSTEGYAMKQNDDLLHGYTVAKATAAVDWSKESTNTKLISATYHAA